MLIVDDILWRMSVSGLSRTVCFSVVVHERGERIGKLVRGIQVIHCKGNNLTTNKTCSWKEQFLVDRHP